MKHLKLYILVTLLTLLAAGQTSVWAANTWTVEYVNGKFKITRSGDLSITETVQYRTVSLSAFAGQHFTSISGTETFGPNQDFKEVSVSEGTPGTDAYKYQNGSSRSYRFEVLDQGGFCLAYTDRSSITGTNVPISGLFSEKEITIYTDPVQYSDAGYNQSNNPHCINSSSYYSLGGIAPAAYYTLIGAQLRSTLSFDAKEQQNGYQYVQILFDNTSSCDGRSGCSDGDPGTPSLSRYMAGFDHQPGSANTTYAAYTFPVTSQPNDNINPVDNAWDNGVTNKFYKQRFKSGYRATDGRLIVPVDFNTFVVRFNASGGGGLNDQDKWYAQNVKAHIQAVDGTAPLLVSTDAITVSSGPYNRGTEFYISVPFREIVTFSGSTKKLTTSWGDATYEAGSGSNVLTFKGTINVIANMTLSISGREGTIADLAGNTFSGSLNKTFDGITSVDPTYTITYNLDGGTVATANPTSYKYTSNAITLNNPTRPGYRFDGWTGSNGSTPQTSVTINKNSHGNRSYTANWTQMWTGSGTQGSPYTITSTEGLDYLASYVNAGNNCSGIFFQLGNDITYTASSLWNNESSTENNFTPIARIDRPFCGRFDGQNHTISGIRIYKSDDNDLGLFCKLGNGGVITRVVLANTRINTGVNYVGGIVGMSDKGSTISYCTVSDDVAIFFHNAGFDGCYRGGIAGDNSGDVRCCISSATLTSNLNASSGYGGIVGMLSSTGSAIRSCIAKNAVISTPSSDRGPVYGSRASLYQTEVTNSYYRSCTINGVQNQSDVYSITLPDGVTLVRTASSTLPGTGNKTYTTGADIDDVPYAFDGATLTLSYTGAALSEGYTYAVSINGTRATDNGNGTYTATMPAADATVTVSTVAKDFTADGHSGDSEADAYIIYNKDQLDLLVKMVNGTDGYVANTFESKFIKLANDIEYHPATDWNDVTSQEHNFTAIGRYSGNTNYYFQGTFDGDNHTVSGVRIYKNSDTSADSYQGLFGNVGSSGTVKNVIVSDARITGYYSAGGIVGQNKGDVINCHAANTVAIASVINKPALYHGGIVGDNVYGIIRNCTSAATLTANNQSAWFYGAITGWNEGCIENCHAVYAIITAQESYYGVITGYNQNGGILTDNYYRGCTVGDTANAVNVGVGNGDGAPADQTGARSVHALSLLAGATASGESVVIDAATYYAAGTTITLNHGSAPAGYQEPFLGFSLDGTPIDGNTFTMPAADATVTARWTVKDFTSGHAGTEADPYIIYNKEQLDQLASNVNSGTNYSNKFIKLGADIEYDGTENNFTPIGTFSNEFYGNFDGDGHTISGIRINSSSNYQGLFGYFRGGIVKDVTLSDCDITGHENVGGIVGRNDGIVSNCRVKDDVFIRADANDAKIHGGIVGYNSHTVEGCFSAATVTRRAGLTSCWRYSAIVGENYGTIRNSIAVGAKITAAESNKGAIVGYNSSGSTLANNYYYGCTVNSATTNVGTGNGDITDNDGAVQAISSPTKPAEIGAQIASYSNGLTVYEHGAYYNGTYYLRHDLAGTAVGLNLTQGTKDGVTAWWGTFYDGTTNHTLSEGAAAYTLGTDYKLYRLGDDGHTIPAGTAVVIIATSADAAIVPAGTAALSITDHAPYGNILVGNDADTTYPTIYVLSVNAGEVGFRKLTSGTLPAHKAGYTTKGTGIPNYDKKNKQEW